MKYDNYLDDRNDILRPRRTEAKPRTKKSNHKHEYTVVEMRGDEAYMSCQHCEKTVIRYRYT